MEAEKVTTTIHSKRIIARSMKQECEFICTREKVNFGILLPVHQSKPSCVIPELQGKPLWYSGGVAFSIQRSPLDSALGLELPGILYRTLG